jgi:hypothetical protein
MRCDIYIYILFYSIVYLINSFLNLIYGLEEENIIKNYNFIKISILTFFSTGNNN